MDNSSCDEGHRLKHRMYAAFTLVELLVVLAIVTALIAILLPSMSAARRNARKTECQANLRQIAIAWDDYLDKNSDNFFQGINANFVYGGVVGRGASAYQVPRPLNPVLGLPELVDEGAEVFRCPADNGNKTILPSHFKYYGTSYVTNTMLIGQDQIPVNPADPCKTVLRAINKRLKKLTRSKVSTSPSKLVLLGDMGWLSEWNRYDPNKIEWHDRKRSHNLAFMDGHVDFVTVRKGLHVTDSYAIIPFANLLGDAAACQQEVP